MKASAAFMVAVVLLALVYASPRAQYDGGWIGIYDGYWGSFDCTILDSSPSTLELHVVHAFAEGTSIRFMAPIPDCMNGATFLYDTSAYTVTGSSQAGVTVDYGGCIQLPVAVLTIVVATSGASEYCCPFRILPHPMDTSGEVEAVDCQDNLLYVDTETAVVNGDEFCPCPYNESPEIVSPTPADGAAGVSTETLLSWVTIDPDDDDVNWYGVFLDTVPEPARVEDQWYDTSYDPGVLEPNKTYYWQIASYNCSDDPPPPCTYFYTSAASPVWSFTTAEGPVRTEARTWGAIKALYGD